MPVEWDELETRPDRYTLLTVPGRLKRLGVDPWAKYWTSRQRISNASFAAIQRL
jgi:DNA primase